MAKPTTVPEFCDDNTYVDGFGKANVTEPDSEAKNYGWIPKGAIPFRDWMNWVHHWSTKWFKWLDTELEPQVNTNTTNIATNTGNITTNTGNITTNGSNISSILLSLNDIRAQIGDAEQFAVMEGTIPSGVGGMFDITLGVYPWTLFNNKNTHILDFKVMEYGGSGSQETNPWTRIGGLNLGSGQIYFTTLGVAPYTPYIHVDLNNGSFFDNQPFQITLMRSDL